MATTNKAKEICNREARGIPYVAILSYLLDIGTRQAAEITDEQIEDFEENGLMTKSFAQGIARGARALARNCEQSDIIRLIKSDWCCAGEVYDPDLDQFVTDTDEE